MKSTLTRTGPLCIALFSMAASATAGSLEPAPIAAPIASPVPVAPIGEWTGFYAGLQLGYADVDGAAGLIGDNETYGVHLGYDYDFGSYVLGAELEYDKTDIDLNAGAASIDNVARLKLKGGYDLGNTLIYATAGAARADTSVGNENGAFLGLGVTYKITDRYTIGAEVLEHRFDDVGGTLGSDVDATTFNLRGSIRF